MKKLLQFLLPTLLLLSLMFGMGACAGKLNHPNAINQLDDKGYDTLTASQAAILEAKAHIADHPGAKDILNQAIAAYDAAVPLYKAYHATGTAEQGQRLQEALLSLSGSIAQLEQAFGKKLGQNQPCPGSCAGITGGTHA